MDLDKYADRVPQPEALADAVDAAAAAPSGAADGLREARWRAHGGPAAAEAELGYPVASFAEYLQIKQSMSEDPAPTDPA